MNKQSTHFNSKIVTIKSKLPIAHESQKNLEEWFSEARVSIGGYFKHSSSTKSGTGLETWEEDALLPAFLGISSEDRDYRKEIEKFYTDINTRVPFPNGIDLEVGLKKDNNKPIIYKDENDKIVENFPIEIEDYLRYRHALGHPQVATTEEEKGAKTYSFYVVDTVSRKEKERKAENIVDTALEYFLDVKRTPKDIAMHLALLGEDYRKIDKEDRPVILKNLILKGRATDFIANYKDTDNVIKFDIFSYVKEGIVTKEGNRYIFEGEQLGATEKDFIEYLKDGNNNQTIAIIKARYHELRK